MEIPEIHVLNRIRWQFFGTLTFKSSRISDRKRHHMWYAYLRQIDPRLNAGAYITKDLARPERLLHHEGVPRVRQSVLGGTAGS